ncbi:MAG TPA: peptide chain release factor N(5)-glutamine methyltransferase [Candidatus Saccharimonadales bacterium]
MTIDNWLKTAEAQLKAAGILSPWLDARLLLSHVLEKPKVWLLAHNEEVVPKEMHSNLTQLLNRRLQHEPLAYIRGQQEFFGRVFSVTNDVLVPRPETEAIIEKLQTISIEDGDTLIDVGTGSGCIAISAKLEFPELKVYGLDVSKPALSVAAQNAANLYANVTFICADIIETTLPHPASIITANLPYVDRSWQVSPETDFEPPLALYADSGGLQLIFSLLTLASSATVLRSKGHLLLEADPRQHAAIIKKTLALGFYESSHEGFILHFQKH